MSPLTIEVAVADFKAAGCCPTPAGEDKPGLWYAFCPVCQREAAIAERDGKVEIACSQGCSLERITHELHYLRAERGTSGQASGLHVVHASEVKMDRPRFLLADRVPLGAMTMLVGDPGLGKSTWSCLLAAEVTTGHHGPPGVVLMANAEDAPGQVIVPRLAAAGADRDLVRFFSVHDSAGERAFTLPDDVAQLEQYVEAERTRLVVIDPLMAFLSDSANTRSDHSVRRALAELAAMAVRQNVAVVVVAHLNKSQGTDPLYRVGGSIGLVGGARSVLLFARDPEDHGEEQGGRRALGHVKSNWGRLAPTLLYEHEPVEVTGNATTVGTHRLKVVGESDTPGVGLLGVDPEDSPATQRERATELLADMLGDGAWRRASEVKTAAKRQNISRKTLDRAAHAAGVQRDQRGQHAIAWWRLSPVGPTPVTQHVGSTPWPNRENGAVEPNQGSGEALLGHLSNDDPTGPERLPDRLTEQATDEPAEDLVAPNRPDGEKCGECGSLKAWSAGRLVCFDSVCRSDS